MEAINFSKAVVVFPSVSAREERERLVRAVTTLCDEIGGDGDGNPPDGSPVEERLRRDAFGDLLPADDERLVTDVSDALDRLRQAAARASDEPPSPPVFGIGVMGGAEMLMRAEILAGRRERLPELIPTFTYLATLPFLGQAEALRISERAAGLLDGKQR